MCRDGRMVLGWVSADDDGDDGDDNDDDDDDGDYDDIDGIVFCCATSTYTAGRRNV